MVGTAAKHLEPSEGGIIDSKHDVDRIMLQHSYAHPYTDACKTVESQIEKQTNIPETDGDKGDIFYANCDEDNECVTIEVPCEDQQMVEENKSVTIETYFDDLTTDIDVTLENNMKLLSPMCLSPRSMDENLLAVSPAHTALSSDLGYESLASPLSEVDSLDLSDFWCESFSELFPGLA